ncbi:putative P-loop containing nucleoside triphosphate hydrolase [Helianthus anomalus]
MIEFVSYQIEALAQAIKENTIVFLGMGSGKTLIAIMLLCHYAYLLKKPSPCIAVFLVVGTHCRIGQTELYWKNRDDEGF